MIGAMYRCLLVVALSACHGTSAATAVDAPASPADGSGATADAPPSCPAALPACPTAPASLTRGSGMVPIDRCAFPLVPGTVPSAAGITLPAMSITALAGDLNRTATRVTPASVPGTAPGIKRAYTWESGDESVAYWIPQGITGTWDAGTATGAKQLALVSWYYKQANDPGSTVDKGVRIAVADVTNPDAVAYRFALLVSPTGDGSFAPVAVHAGGLAWVGDRLYVPVTGSGFRVFDLAHVYKVDGLDGNSIGKDPATGKYNAFGYAYAIPEIARVASPTPSCKPVFSFVSVDHSTTPPTLVSGEYSATEITGRLYRWPIDTSTTIYPTGAWISAEQQVQGAFALGDTWWLSSSRPAGGAGELDRTQVGAPSTALGWSDSPESLSYDPADETVWSLTEGEGARYLFEVSQSALR